jgi:hypothetical protein
MTGSLTSISLSIIVIIIIIIIIIINKLELNWIELLQSHWT